MPTVSDGLIVNSDLAQLPRIGEWVDAWARSHCVPTSLTNRVQLCCVEAVTNIIMHAHGGHASHPVKLALGTEGETVALAIEDDGAAFDPLQQSPPQAPNDLETAPLGGWGIPLMRRFSDEMRYRREDARNILTLVFRLRPADRIDSRHPKATE
jgi:anti-sigma regulatory factor (Ser/Thr protein kinase)